MGDIYLGVSPSGERVVIKLVQRRLLLEKESRERYLERFRREVAAALEVSPAYTARVRDADLDADPPWVAIEHLPGLSLSEAMSLNGPWPAESVRLLAAAVAEALADIHRAGLTHRDIKPANIMLTPGGPRVIDFGIVRPHSEPPITGHGRGPGTAGFMPPEQAAGAASGPECDIFELGAVLAFALTGHDQTSPEAVQAGLGRTGDAKLHQLILSCLHLNPRKRPTATALLRKLGNPADSVQGTRWLPPEVAELIDNRIGRLELGPVRPDPPGTRTGPHLPGRVVDLNSGDTLDDPPRTRSRGALAKDLARRPFIVGGAAAAALAGAAILAWLTVRTGDDPDSAPPRSPAAPPSPPRGKALWQRELFTGDETIPELYSAGGVALLTGGVSEATRVRALSPRTGETLWTRRVDGGGMVPLVPGTDLVFAVLAHGDLSEALHAIDPLSGETRWSHSPGSGFGFVAELSAAGDLVFYIDADELIALDDRNGQRRWRTQRPDAAFTAGTEVLAAVSDDTVTVLDTRDGRVRWRFRAERRLEHESVAIGADVVVVRDSFGKTYVLDVDDGTVTWARDADMNSEALWLSHGLLVVREAEGFVQALRVDTGRRAWSFPPLEAMPRRKRSASPSVHFVLGLAGGTLWVAADDTVYALNVADGRVLWTYDAIVPFGEPANPFASAVVAVDDVVLIGTEGGFVEAVIPPRRRR